MLQNQLPGNASATRDRRSTSASMRNMKKPRYASMATLRTTGGGIEMDCFESGEDSRTDDSSAGGKFHLPRWSGLDIIIVRFLTAPIAIVKCIVSRPEWG